MKQNKQNVETAAELINRVAETAPVTAQDKLFAELNSLSTAEFNSLCNRLTLKQLETVQQLFSERTKSELNKVEKEVLAARKMELSELNIKAIGWLLKQPDATADELKTLKPIYFDNSFLTAVAAVQPATDKTGKTAKHNDLSHKFMLSVACYAYIKEANVDNFNSREVQKFEALTLADFTRHCEKNTFANNTTFPVTIDGQSYADKAAAVAAMAALMFNWYQSAIGATVDDKAAA